MNLAFLNGTRNVLCRSVLSLPRHGAITYRRRLHGTVSEPHPFEAPPTQDRFIVTTPLFSAAHEPHIGHLHTLVLADIFKRWHDLKKPEKDSILLTGVNANGIKVIESAIAAGKPPQAFVGQNVAAFRELARRANISDHEFVLVPRLHQQQAVQHAWTLFKNAGLVYRGRFDGFYSVEDDCFYSHEEVRFALNPRTGQKHIAAELTGSEVEQISEKLWFFRLSSFQEDIIKLYEDGTIVIEPGTVRQDVVDALGSRILDCPITRPASINKNGTPVPGEPGNIIHVWLDALLAFLCHCGWPDWQPGSEKSTGWPPALQVVGEEFANVYGIRLPAMLLSIGQPVPRKILCHGQWTGSNKPMKKNLENQVNPFSALRRFEADAVRYYLAREGPRQMSSDWNNEDLAKVWNVWLRQFQDLFAVVCALHYDFTYAITQINTVRASASSMKPIREKLQRLAADVDTSMARLDVPEALAKIEAVMTEVASTVIERDPTQLYLDARHGGKPFDEFHSVVHAGAEALRICAILALPVVPDKSNAILDAIGVRPVMRTFKAAVLGGDDAYGFPLHRPTPKLSKRLFQPFLEL